MHYFLKRKYGETLEVTSAEARVKWPDLLFGYLERRMEWIKPGSNQINAKSTAENRVELKSIPNIQPIRITCKSNMQFSYNTIYFTRIHF